MADIPIRAQVSRQRYRPLRLPWCECLAGSALQDCPSCSLVHRGSGDSHWRRDTSSLKQTPATRSNMLSGMRVDIWKKPEIFLLSEIVLVKPGAYTIQLNCRKRIHLRLSRINAHNWTKFIIVTRPAPSEASKHNTLRVFCFSRSGLFCYDIWFS